MKKKMFDKPSVVFTKKLATSDAYMYGTNWDEEHRNEMVPISVVPVIKANLKTEDTCSLPPNMDTLMVKFNMTVLGDIGVSCAGNAREFEEKLRHSVANYVEKTGLRELAYRYAYNIASARFLWRNRLSADNITVVIEAGDVKLTVDAYDYSLKSFEYKDELEPLAAKIAETLAGKDTLLKISVKAYAQVGYGSHVFPSEELVKEKDNNRSKVLYQNGGVAAMHTQKIGNAIRTIDTWYDDFGTDKGAGPLAVEPFGHSHSRYQDFRNIADGNDFYTLLNKFVNGESLSEGEEHFVVAMLIRGGTFEVVDKVH
ncbi:type I-F CRISPR-associated protein Csy3 [Selenomonas ruminantium]|uniref:CRISPR-associated protein, Csy3 family n=1 Tax=Selenomonas ruminantium TaxID=971 RepID=A0A1I0Y1Y6_SELRU|nr:type I-F CRISPR-associated protein Csy3 [Selenomonas ruminantium]SFB07184.1 CRISPR-associated protein, Csy3 family [Selenomonas ruminantium]